MGGAVSDRNADRWEISELLSRYAWALADRDWDAWLALFTPDARVDYTTAGGVAGTPTEAAEWLRQTFTMFDVTLSHGGNVVVDFHADDRATVRSLYKMVMRIPAAEGGQPTYMEACGWYRDTVVRSGDGWRLADRFEQLAYVRPA